MDHERCPPVNILQGNASDTCLLHALVVNSHNRYMGDKTRNTTHMDKIHETSTLNESFSKGGANSSSCMSGKGDHVLDFDNFCLLADFPVLRRQAAHRGHHKGEGGRDQAAV